MNVVTILSAILSEYVGCRRGRNEAKTGKDTNFTIANRPLDEKISHLRIIRRDPPGAAKLEFKIQRRRPSSSCGYKWFHFIGICWMCSLAIHGARPSTGFHDLHMTKNPQRQRPQGMTRTLVTSPAFPVLVSGLWWRRGSMLLKTMVFSFDEVEIHGA